MADALNLDQGIGRKELTRIQRRFSALHSDRLRRLEQDLKPAQRDFLTLLPLLVHTNHPTLPGFVSSTTPAGLPDYSPDRRTLQLAKKFSRSFSYKKRALQRVLIEGLYLMGSIGSIGQTPHSDLDIWLCHAADLTTSQRDELQAKAVQLEDWGRELGLEVHFFLMNDDAFRHGDMAALSHESSGSAQHHLLLEEFYRTGIRLGGRPVLWWLVPPEHEHEYREFTGQLVSKRFIDRRDWLDFGGLSEVPPDEFFGAAHWQLFKGIDAPYKAILKILLMEAYAAEYPHIQWLSLISKQAIYGGLDEASQIDPYVLIYRKVEAYLSDRNEQERLELARRCLYFKVDQPLSQRRDADNWKRERLQQLVREWGWSEQHLSTLDGRARWKLEQVRQERNLLVRELSQSYRMLMNFARQHAATAGIDPRELNLLGRKLYAALERRPGKIEHINPGISRDLSEERLTFHFVAGDNPRWELYREEDPQELDSLSLKTAASLVELLAWCHVNGVLGLGTQVALSPVDCPVKRSELRRLIDSVTQHLPRNGPDEAPMDALAHRPRMALSLAFVNVGVDPLDHLSQAGLQLTSERADPLSFSGAHLNLAQRIDQLTENTWGEIEVTTYFGTSGLMDCLCRYLQLTLPSRRGVPPLHAIGFGSPRSQGIASRVQHVASGLMDWFGPHGPGLGSRYILEADQGFFLFRHDGEAFSALPLDDDQALFELLAEPLEDFIPQRFDERALADHPLPAIYRANLPDVIQVFAWPRRDAVELFVLDEQGALFMQSIDNADPRHLLVQQQRFLNSLAERQALVSTETAQRMLDYPPEFYRVERDNRGNWRLTGQRLAAGPVVDSYLDLELVSAPDGLDSGNFTLIVGEREFDALILGDALFGEVARYVRSKRREQQGYAVYLTRVVPSGLDDERPWSTLHLFQFKRRIEDRINRAMQALAG